jgi:hypothetical protein
MILTLFILNPKQLIMKKTITLFSLMLLAIGSLNAQDSAAGKDTLWRKGGFISINFNQVSLTNWAAGGENSVSLSGISSLFANYKKGRIAWDNNLDLGYGLVKQGDKELRKNDDKIELNTKFGYDATNKSKWYYTGLVNFKSQFAPGFNYTDTTSVKISEFAAPAFALFAIGMDYKPTSYFSIFLSPITAKFIIVNDDSLSKAGAFGVDPGEKVRTEIGAYLNARFQKEIAANIVLMTKIDLFSNYQENPENIDVNWEVLLGMKINKYISASLSTQLIYDDNTPITIFEGSGKDKRAVGVGPRTQFKQAFGIGFAYKFAGYSVK